MQPTRKEFESADKELQILEKKKQQNNERIVILESIILAYIANQFLPR